MKCTVLVVGGAGYIGSHMVYELHKHNYNIVVLDNLESGHRDAVLHGEFIKGDMRDAQLLDQVFTKYRVDAVMHFASYIQVGESVQYPSKYYDNNVTATLTLLDAMRKHGVNNFIFSSSAAVYGNPSYSPLDEKHPKQPINPYGKSKWMIEQILEDYANAYKLRYMALRYFNAAGAHPEVLLGERHEPETHLIPLVLRAAQDRTHSIVVNGRDYETPDGTCIRDYVHIVDICQAHRLAIEHLFLGRESGAYNLGLGYGFSVLQIIDSVERVTRRNIDVVFGERRAGDPPILVADASKCGIELGWKPVFTDIEDIIQHAWSWMCNCAGNAEVSPSGVP